MMFVFFLDLVSALDCRLVTMDCGNLWSVILDTDDFGCLSAVANYLTKTSPALSHRARVMISAR